MRNAVYAFILLILLAAMPRSSEVYICKGGSAYAYHKTEKCGWLQQCTHSIEKVSEKEAKETYKRKPCKPCYK